jgi:arabinose-5-phosphate isomerase
VHPGGLLGGKLRLVSGMMHSGPDLPKVGGAASMKDAIDEMSQKGLGMTCVVDDAGRLLGVMTDGDLRRRMLSEAAPLEGSAAEAMTPSPTTLSPDAVAAEALQIMEQRKITSLPVVDDAGKLQGVVHIHALWRTELF